MYEYKIRGSEDIEGEVRKIGKAIAVTVPKDWLGEEVIVIRKAELTGKNITENQRVGEPEQT